MTGVSPAVLAFVLVFAGLFGLVIGSFLNVVIYRVPAGIPLTRESRCPHCDEPVRPVENIPVVSWLVLRGRCAGCKAPISARYPIVELATALAFVGITWYFVATATLDSTGAVWSLVLTVAAFLYLASISIALTLIDLDTHRLPNAIVLPAYAVGAVLLVAASVLVGDLDALVRAAIGMAALYAFYFILRFVRPDGMGGGDVKLAGVLGLYLGWLGWGALVVGAFGAFLLGGIFGIGLLITRRAGRKTAIPFGPWMILGAWVGVFGGESLSRWYLGLFITA
ncbi:A24 family peptidase [Microbacterium sp. C7(2022)]|uniref:prepilin peptidase n=1 Tax=Microbacterium sp. C7(2022) TaxID=2992759 RepID=UPI00237AC62D|nr:A24 family peptidase [Microbacterium sp. C7(2022)]MDE0546719.1 prepilin peptidase [Microbacterium sp. C7(2022)]